MTGMKYEVGYDKLDPAKVIFQKAASSTGGNVTKRFGRSWKELAWSRGESAHITETPFGFIAHVDEGLGTKDLSAQYMQLFTGDVSGYASVAQDNAAMILNDLVTSGALPVSLSLHLAVGDAAWLSDLRRVQAIADGYVAACNLATTMWGPGETPNLKTHLTTVATGAVILAGSAWGYAPTRGHIIHPGHIENGDLIYLVESSGVHANGISLLREIALRAPQGYSTKLEDGKTFLESILTPTHVYVPLIAALHREGVDIHYAMNITGHGWRKIMRAPQAYTYRIHTAHPLSPIFSFIQKYAAMSEYDLRGDYNANYGFGLIVPPSASRAVENVLAETKQIYGYGGYRAGTVVNDGYKRVILEPLGITYTADTLAVR